MKQTTGKKQVEVNRWYWSAPAEGMTIEDCEAIVRESLVEKRETDGMQSMMFAVFS